MTVYHVDHDVTLHVGDTIEVMRGLPESSVDCVVTSPPYFGLRDYGHPGQYGLETSPAEYVARMVEVFAEVRRLLRPDGTCWVNIGDSYASTGGTSGVGPNAVVTQTKRQATKRTRPMSALQPKNLIGMPWRVAFGLQDDGWILRNAVVWNKPNAMPESVRDRLSTRYETVFLLTRSARYWFDLDAIREPLAHPETLDVTRVFGGKNKDGTGGTGASARRRGHNVYGSKHQPLTGGHGTMGQDGNGRRYPEKYDTGRGRNPGDVWTLSTQPYPEAHFAVMPPELARRCILAGCRPGGTVLDSFSGSGTTGMVARQTGRRYVGIDLRAEYHDLAVRRMGDTPLPFGEAS